MYLHLSALSVTAAQPGGHCPAAGPLQVVSQVGSWGNYIASMDIVERMGGGSAVLVSCVVIVRLVPSLFLFPAAGVVADR